MPWFAAMIGKVLLMIAASMVARVLVSLGLSVVTYVGISRSLDWLKDRTITAFAALPPEIYSLLVYLKVGTCISILFSAMFASMLLQGLGGDTFKKWIIN